jgi:glutamate N-acetyltransferase/amino-acid N-acetyltransferase
MAKMLSVVFARGFKVGSGRGGLKTKGDDVMFLVADEPAVAAALFTTNKMFAAPVRYSREVARRGHVKAIVANAGNANAATGDAGYANAKEMARLAAGYAGCRADAVFVASTGVIGRPLDMAKVRAGISAAAANLDVNAAAAAAAARAIMTTDTRPKSAQREINISGRPVRIGGITKGVGMLSPRLATMLCFLTTDAKASPAVLRRALGAAAEMSFDRVTVDGDMSTNDSLFLLASGRSPAPAIKAGTPRYRAFVKALTEVCVELAKMMAADGEGATKLVTVNVSRAASDAAALAQARAIANSPLVKTALFGCDPNWGRVLAAAGYAGAPFEEKKAVLSFNGVVAFRKGVPLPKSGAINDVMKEREITIELDLGLGKGRAVVYTCDYSYDYVKINAEYHT